MHNKIHQGDVRVILRSMDAESVDCVITSPPYWNLREYGTPPQYWGGALACKHTWQTHTRKPGGGRGSKCAMVGANKNDTANARDHDIVSAMCSTCGMWQGSLGMEPDSEMFIANLCAIFKEVQRVLKPEGTCWVNIGDTYNAGRNGGHAGGTKGFHKLEKHIQQSGANDPGTPAKSLCMIPYRFATAMIREHGWRLRNVIVWQKPNCMPSSIKDRFSNDFEPVFFFTKSERYFFNTQYERAVGNFVPSQAPKRVRDSGGRRDGFTSISGMQGGTINGRIKRCVWEIPTKGSGEEHYASYPEALVEPMIDAGCPIGGVVLDPFLGTGTTAAVAKRMGRKFVGIELSGKYVEIAARRLAKTNSYRRWF